MFNLKPNFNRLINFIFVILLTAWIPRIVYAKPNHTSDIIITKPQSSNNDASVINRMNKYMLSLGDFTAEFEQYTEKDQSKGLMIVSRKNHGLRCNYFPPYPFLIVVNKNSAAVYDYDLHSLVKGEVSRAIWDFLMNGKLNPEVQIVSAHSNLDEDYIQIQHNNEISATLTFGKNPNYHLKLIEIIDANNTATKIKFGSIKKVHLADKSLFIVRDPKTFGKQKRLDFHDIQKLLK